MCQTKKFYLFLCFLESHALTELGAVFLELYLAGDELLVFAGPIGLACFFVFELYEVIL